MRTVTNKISSNVRTAIIAIRAFHPVLPFKLLYAFSKHAVIDKHFEDLDAARIKLCEELAEKTEGEDGKAKPLMKDRLDDNGEVVKNPATGEVLQDFVFSDENLIKLNEQYTKLLEEKVEVPSYRVSASDINIELPSDQIPYLHDFMEYMVRD